jgi:Protein of unknown function (DUF2934)
MKKTSLLNSRQPYLEQQSLSHRDEGNMQERIRQRAYELYEERGCHDGHDEEDWAQAEEQVRGESGFDKAA